MLNETLRVVVFQEGINEEARNSNGDIITIEIPRDQLPKVIKLARKDFLQERKLRESMVLNSQNPLEPEVQTAIISLGPPYPFD